MGNVALIVIYNHQYNENIEVIESIYTNRFSNIYHLVPFYLGSKANVISVYENSIYFQGYVPQGLKHFLRKDFQHYFFIADDLLLNPYINEGNYEQFFKLNSNTCFIPEFINLHEPLNWPRTREAFEWKIKCKGVEVRNQIPDYESTLKKFQKFGLELKPLTYNQAFLNIHFSKPYKIINLLQYLFFRIRKIKYKNTKFNLSYPLVGSYSDIFIVSSDAIKQFAHYCGVFSSTNLFVEVAIPTSIVLAANDIVTEANLEAKGRALWNKEDFEFLTPYKYSLKKILLDFPKDTLYIHPIKLSKWDTTL